MLRNSKVKLYYKINYLTLKKLNIQIDYNSKVELYFSRIHKCKIDYHGPDRFCPPPQIG
jgi:hypothetical protein